MKEENRITYGMGAQGLLDAIGEVDDSGDGREMRLLKRIKAELLRESLTTPCEILSYPDPKRKKLLEEEKAAAAEEEEEKARQEQDKDGEQGTSKSEVRWCSPFLATIEFQSTDGETYKE